MTSFGSPPIRIAYTYMPGTRQWRFVFQDGNDGWNDLPYTEHFVSSNHFLTDRQYPGPAAWADERLRVSRKDLADLANSRGGQDDKRERS